DSGPQLVDADGAPMWPGLGGIGRSNCAIDPTRFSPPLPEGTIRQLPGPVYASGIQVGPDCNMWATSDDGLIRISPGLAVTTFPVPWGWSGPSFLLGPDDSFWLALRDGIARIQLDGEQRFFDLRETTGGETSSGAGVEWITTGSDGALWFTESMPG